MPFPIAHSSAGLAGYFAFRKGTIKNLPRQELCLLGLCVFLANFPDLDFIPGFLYGEPGMFHHGISHSILGCLPIALICYCVVSTRLRDISKKRVFLCCLLSTLSHPILDYFSLDTAAPLGVPLLWPFDDNYYMSSLFLFRDARRIEDTFGTFFASLMSVHNGWELVVETLFSGTILCALIGFKTRANSLRSSSYFLISVLCGLLYYLIQTSPNFFR